VALYAASTLSAVLKAACHGRQVLGSEGSAQRNIADTFDASMLTACGPWVYTASLSASMSPSGMALYPFYNKKALVHDECCR